MPYHLKRTYRLIPSTVHCVIQNNNNNNNNSNNNNNNNNSNINNNNITNFENQL